MAPDDSQAASWFETPHKKRRLTMRVLHHLKAGLILRSIALSDALEDGLHDGEASLLLRTVRGPAAGSSDEIDQEHEAIEDSGIAAIEHRERALRRVRHEIGNRHVAGQNEGHRTCEETNRKQRAANQFDNTLKPQQRAHSGLNRPMRKVEQLRGAVLEKQQPDHDTGDAEHLGCIFTDAI